MFLGKQICNQCEQSNPAKTTYCTRCGAILDETIAVGKSFREELHEQLVKLQEMRRLQEFRAIGTNPLTASTPQNIILTEQITGIEFIIEWVGADNIIIGRAGSENDETASIDLSKLAGWNGGVSRQHASLIRLDNNWHVIDHYSKNGTYLNGKRIQPEKAHSLQDKDFISFGYVNFFVTFSSE